MLLLGFTKIFNTLGHQSCFRHRAWKVRLILLRGSNFNLRFFYVPRIYDTRSTALLPFRRKSYSGFLRSEKIHGSPPGSNPRTSEPEASMITTGPPGSTFSFVVTVLGHPVVPFRWHKIDPIRWNFSTTARIVLLLVPSCKLLIVMFPNMAQALSILTPKYVWPEIMLDDKNLLLCCENHNC